MTRTRFGAHRRLLLGASFLITLGSFAVLPYMSVLLHERFGLGLGVVGLVLAVASLVQFSGGVVGAALAARIGLRTTMLTALAVRTAGFGTLVPAADRPEYAIAALLLISVGAALYLPANKAYLVAGRPAEERPRLLAASGSAFNLGIALGPPAAAPLVLTSPTALFAAVTVVFALVAAAHLVLPETADEPEPEPSQPSQPSEESEESEESAKEPSQSSQEPVEGPGEPAEGPGGPADDRSPPAPSPFAYTLLSVYVFMFFQHYLALYAVPRTSAAFYGFLLMGYALLLVVGQPLFADRIARLGYPRALWLGFGAMAAGTAAVATGGPPGIVLGAVLICTAETVLFLRNDLEALARTRAPAATVFGRQRLAAGLGAFGAALFGGPLYGAAEQAGDASWFWLAVAAQSVLLPLLLWAVVRVRRRRRGGGREQVRRRPAPAGR
ncbi:MFS transporter [Streptomyces yaizuensis]|uniref:MFS transporter n=1 Tax=Streptomyces yaizuensis TaxID=2989713 RepID=A0ABQ5P078_9ACTN|nr:MFS transporter [Streptomyces sp. YSPA8]GLF95843.1 MFS transporter [Streptomyces sp. YSPA8]